MTMSFKQATRTQARARIALVGPSGAGKTYSALRIARGLAGPDGRVAVIDTEHGSASKYAGTVTDFDVLELDEHSPDTYVKAILAAEAAGYDVVVIDSLSHAWSGRGGALELVDEAAARSKSSNSFAAWRLVTPKHNRLIDAIVGCKCHVVATMRAKTAYVLEQGKNGKTAPRKVGLEAVQRDGMEYEFDIVADIDLEHNLVVSKTRMAGIDAAVIPMPDEDFGRRVGEWLSDGAPIPEPTEDELRQRQLEAELVELREAMAATKKPEERKRIEAAGKAARAELEALRAKGEAA